MNDRGGALVVEAVLEGVRKISYPEWLAHRPGELVWHGRMKEGNGQERAQIASGALRQIGKPYNFWNLNLADDSSFYCSKLAWLAAFQALGVAPDDNPNPRRDFWYSPKQLMHSLHVRLLHNPGNYLSE